MTAAARKLDRLVGRFETAFRPQRIRSFVEFAEKEIRLPDGPRKDMRYKASFMPFSRYILEEFHRGRFQEFWGSGPVQASKTLHFFVIPALYHLFEIGEKVILGAPTVDMAKAAYRERILPAINKTVSKYWKFLPEHGGGSRGGVANLIQLKNGASIQFIGAGGGDKQVRSYTARVVIITEVDAMDEAGKGSDEADPVTKMIARTESFKERARVYAECTMTNPEGRIARQVMKFGTDSRVFLRCPHCGKWIWPDRAGLVGWQDAADEAEAKAKVRYQCANEACKAPWMEEDRRRAMEDPRVVARGQTINEVGEVVGPLPDTTAWGFRWNAMANPLTTLQIMASREWKAAESGSDEDEKGVVQHIWAEPWEKKTDLFRPDAEAVLRKIVRLERGTFPDGTRKLTMGIDIGSWVIYWALVAWRDEARGHVVDFGSLDVPIKVRGEKDPIAILNTLREFRDKTCAGGWNGRHVDRFLVDSGYQQEILYSFVLESGQGRWLACRGFGTNTRHGQWTGGSAHDPTATQVAGPEWKIIAQPSGINLVAVHSDHWKGLVHDGLFAPEGAAGSITLPFADPKSDPRIRQFARHMISEQREYVQAPGKEQKIVWVVKDKQNHWLDCLTYARAAADIEGIKLAPVKPPARRTLSVDQRTTRPIRTKY